MCDHASFLISRANSHPAAGTTVAYVHYPTISDDMVKSVSSGAVAPNNQRGGRSIIKLAYYHLVCRPMYFFGGQFVNLAMANSKWTRAHVEKRWGGMRGLNRCGFSVVTW